MFHHQSSDYHDIQSALLIQCSIQTHLLLDRDRHTSTFAAPKTLDKNSVYRHTDPNRVDSDLHAIQHKFGDLIDGKPAALICTANFGQKWFSDVSARAGLQPYLSTIALLNGRLTMH